MQSTVVKRVPRPVVYPPEPLPAQLSIQEAARLRAHELDRLPRLSRCIISTPDEFERRLDACVCSGLDMRDDFYNEPSKMRWAEMIDILDDLHDLFSTIHGDFHEGAMIKSPCVRLLAIGTHRPWEVGDAPKALSVQEQACRDRVMGGQYLSAPMLNSASRFCERIEDVLLNLVVLRRRDQERGEPDWGRWADLLDEVADLMDAVRPNLYYGTQATLRVMDLPVATNG